MEIQISTRNQMANVHNIHQGTAKRVLCVCSAGLLRSATTANVLQREFGYNVRNAGVADYALIPLSTALISWADEIVCAERPILTMFGHMLRDCRLPGGLPWYTETQIENILEKTIALDIPDQFDFMDEQLQKEILEQYKKRMNTGKEPVVRRS